MKIFGEINFSRANCNVHFAAKTILCSNKIKTLSFYFIFSGIVSVKIADRYGEIFDEFGAPGKDIFLDWHKDGDFLAAVGTKPAHVSLYTMSTKEVVEIDLGLANK